MDRVDFSRMRCPVARTMAVLGERWAILVMREAFYGTRRFDAFQRHLGIASNILSARLRTLVAHGVLERVAPERGSGGRHDYRLTEKGRDFFPAYLALKRWGDRWMADPEGPLLVLLDKVTGEPVTSPMPRRATGEALGVEDVAIVPGPGATDQVRERFGAGAKAPTSGA
jgi:DNA-binding HxlR family transcriptional regulator